MYSKYKQHTIVEKVDFLQYFLNKLRKRQSTYYYNIYSDSDNSMYIVIIYTYIFIVVPYKV